MTTTRGVCPTCGKDRAVTTKGVMRSHERGLVNSWEWARCDGSGEKPARRIDPDAAVKAATLREAAEIAEDEAQALAVDMGEKATTGARLVAARLRVRAEEIQGQPTTEESR